jgi:taurine dioxygenase
MGMTIVGARAPLGAEVLGIDLARLGDSDFAQIRSALNKYSVLSIRDQAQLTPAQQVDFVSRLGPLQPYAPNSLYHLAEAPDLVILSNIMEGGVPLGAVDAGNTWHTDLPYMERPPAYAALYAVEVPQDADGRALGNTMTVSSGHAYDTLPADLKARLSGMKALHRRAKLKLSETRLKFKSQYDSDDLECVHPVVRTHPVTGRKGLYINKTYTVRLLDVDEAESDELLERLCQHITRPDVRYIHSWQVGDLLLWDDCAIQHCAVPDYKLPQRRCIHRGTVAGTRPY